MDLNQSPVDILMKKDFISKIGYNYQHARFLKFKITIFFLRTVAMSSSKHEAVNQMIVRLRAGEHCAEVRLPGTIVTK